MRSQRLRARTAGLVASALVGAGLVALSLGSRTFVSPGALLEVEDVSASTGARFLGRSRSSDAPEGASCPWGVCGAVAAAGLCAAGFRAAMTRRASSSSSKANLVSFSSSLPAMDVTVRESLMACRAEGEAGQPAAQEVDEQKNQLETLAKGALGVAAAVAVVGTMGEFAAWFDEPAFAKEDVIPTSANLFGLSQPMTMTLAEATADPDAPKPAPSGDWLQPIVDFNAGLIAGIDDFMEKGLHLPNSFGFAIIGYTFAVKAVTFPLNQSSLRQNAMMQLVAPKMKQIQAKYKDDPETSQRMVLRLYDDCGINPIGGVIPSLLQLPIFIALYRSINTLASKSDRFKEPFLWLPSLAGPGSADIGGLDWLLKSKYDDHFEPLIGWQNAGLYLTLPAILLVNQYVTQQIANPQAAQQQGGLASAFSVLGPMIITYTAMVSPAGIGIYWLTNNLLTTVQTTFIKNGLQEEFPEYRKILDGSKEKEDAERAARLLKEKEAAKFKGRGAGFGTVFPEKPEAKEEEPEEEPEAAEPEGPKKRKKTLILDEVPDDVVRASKRPAQKRKGRARGF